MPVRIEHFEAIDVRSLAIPIPIPKAASMGDRQASPSRAVYSGSSVRLSQWAGRTTAKSLRSSVATFGSWSRSHVTITPASRGRGRVTRTWIRSLRLLDHGDATFVCGVGGVEQRHDRARIENERHRLRASATACRGVLVVGDRRSCRSVAAHDPESRRRRAPESPRLVLDRLPQELGKRNAAPARLAFEHSEIIGVCRHGRSSNGHASDASLSRGAGHGDGSP